MYICTNVTHSLLIPTIFLIHNFFLLFKNTSFLNPRDILQISYFISTSRKILGIYFMSYQNKPIHYNKENKQQSKVLAYKKASTIDPVSLFITY